MREFFSALSCPEAPEAYGVPEDIVLPEGVNLDQDFVGAMQKAFWGIGVPKEAWSRVMKAFTTFQTNRLREIDAKMAHQADENLKALQQKWGSSFPTCRQQAEDCLAHVFGDSWEFFRQATLPDGSRFGDDPRIWEIFQSLGEQMSEGRIIEGVPPRTTLTPEEAQREVNRLMSDPEFREKYDHRSNADHEWAVKRRADLFKIIAGGEEKEAVGSAVGLPVTGGEVV